MLSMSQSHMQSPPPQNIWDNLQCVLGVNVPFAEYATHDNRVESSERMDDSAIIEAVASEHETVAVDENEDPDARAEEIIKISTEFLHIIAQQKAYILCNILPKSI